MDTLETQRLNEKSDFFIPPWRKWGPYMSERAWGTVREDYSADGNAWAYFPHGHAASRAYRWGDDGLGGICDRYQIMCFALALWNGHDPILKERLYGVIPGEGNHGEDVKEYYFYLDSTPTHSYMKFLYKYPQAEFPYRELVEQNQRRTSRDPEFELLDTGIFNENRYFDVFVEYAKASPEDMCIRVEVCNRGPEDAPIHVLPHLWFRNTWIWGDTMQQPPVITMNPQAKGCSGIIASDVDAEPLGGLAGIYSLGERFLYGEAGGQPLFTNNETNNPRIWGPQATNRTPYVKDAFHRYVVYGEQEAVNPDQIGTKACLHYANLNVPAGGSVVLRFRLTDTALEDPLGEVDEVLKQRKQEADEFYTELHPPKASDDEKLVQRQALAGMLWSKQFYYYHVAQWLRGDNSRMSPPESRYNIRNQHWLHLNTMRLMSMPDKWEYPWFAAWDLAFHCVPLTLVDPEFAKEQLWLLLFEQFQHPNGQIPAYEWEFSDLNPPVHAWAVWRIYNMEKFRTGKPDRDFLEKCFHKLLINFTWWINRVDAEDNNIFEGGFLGFDNITVIDRSQKLADGVVLEQSDATGWMGMFCLNLMRIALELSHENPVYEALATKFFQHYVYVGSAMRNMGSQNYQLWDENDHFFYDVLRYPDGDFVKFRVRSLVGLVPLYAIERLEENWIAPFKTFKANLDWFIENRQDLTRDCVTTLEVNGQKVHILAVISPEQMRGILERVRDPNEFNAPYGLRSLSKYHEHNPYHFGSATVRYEPAESIEMLKGGNSNWRGPVWFPTSFMMVEAMRKLHKAYGDGFRITDKATLELSMQQLANELISVFTLDGNGRRPVFNGSEKFQTDPLWRDNILFYEYFHGDTGAGLGASHQTGWTGLVASLIDEWRR